MLSGGSNGQEQAFLIFSGSNERAVIAFCRTLARHGLGVYIVARTQDDPVLRTRYRRNVVAVRQHNRLEFEDLERCIVEARRKSGIERFVLAPCSEFLNLFLLENAAWFECHGCSIPLVDLTLYRRVSDKYSFSRLCGENGIRIPRQITQDEPRQFPFVAKPLENVTSTKRSLYPHLIFSADDWAKFRRNENPEEFYFEEFIEGSSHYLLLYLSRQGEVTAWSQRNLVQQPDGKSIVMAESAQIHHEAFAQQYVELLRSLGFWGLAMLEVMKREEDCVFIELNPRFWGPFQLLLNAHSPIITRFIEDQLGIKLAASSPPPREQGGYLWFGGYLQTLAAGQRVIWHTTRPQREFRYLLSKLRDDVFLHFDTLPLFWHETRTALRERYSRREATSGSQPHV